MLPLILIDFLAVPELIKERRSLRSTDSTTLSCLVMSGLIEMVGLLTSLALLARIVETSRVLVSF